MSHVTAEMGNTSAVTSFVLTGYSEMEKLAHLYFSVFFILYVCIIVSNSVLIGVIYTVKLLHEPMHLHICNLMCNGLYGSTGLFPFLLKNLSSQSYEVSIAGCLAQVFCLHTFSVTEFTILAVMSYDRYIAICYPLQYRSIMSARRLRSLLAFSWCYPFVTFGLHFLLTVRLTFCSRVIFKVYCANFFVLKLSCSDITVNNIIGLLSIGVLILPQVITILFSYTRILIICMHSGKESQGKALRTCGPHLLAVINYSIGCLFEVIQSRFNMSHMPYEAYTFLSLYFLIFPPLLNPVIYGVSIRTIRIQISCLFRGKSKLSPTVKR
ncbi:olfactory receptor 5AC2-like [Paramormyrops kingsleyae]|uniref:Olfactory receptor n=1 Tax=Paramormyrops kingsleyae TaxID=1676925 RepID=A0A3B3TF88_9TELE|nr:putative gustatory receptor clone PTE03 [Paramormyrops kingsleyae]